MILILALLFSAGIDARAEAAITLTDCEITEPPPRVRPPSAARAVHQPLQPVGIVARPPNPHFVPRRLPAVTPTSVVCYEVEREFGPVQQVSLPIAPIPLSAVPLGLRPALLRTMAPLLSPAPVAFAPVPIRALPVAAAPAIRPINAPPTITILPPPAPQAPPVYPILPTPPTLPTGNCCINTSPPTTPITPTGPITALPEPPAALLLLPALVLLAARRRLVKNR